MLLFNKEKFIIIDMVKLSVLCVMVNKSPWDRGLCIFHVLCNITSLMVFPVTSREKKTEIGEGTVYRCYNVSGYNRT